MNQPSKETAKLLLNFIKNTTLPIVLKKIEEENKRKEVSEKQNEPKGA